MSEWMDAGDGDDDDYGVHIHTHRDFALASFVL